MKVIAMLGSPRGAKSQTRVLTEKLLETARAGGAEVELVDVSRARIGFCQACEACHAGPDCVLHDDGQRLLKRMLDADGVVLASPVYISQVTAQMKALLDRTSHFIHCLRLMGKYMAIVTTSGGGGGQDVQTWLRNYGFTVGMQCVGGVDVKMPLKESDLAAAAALGNALVTAIRDKPTWPEQAQAIQERQRYFARLIAFRKDHWPYEYKYWQEKGWL
jgi:multimeric flavodoxin WrbA